MNVEEAISTLMENICMSCAYDANCMDECDIRGCDNRDAIKVIIGEVIKKSEQKTVLGRRERKNNRRR